MAKSKFDQELKRKSAEQLPINVKNSVRLNSLNQIVKEINNKENRYIFYCPDIALVNPLVKLIYETALQIKNAGYNVIILHEVNGFKAKWLYEIEDYKDFRSLKTEYVINKVSSKSKRTKSNYSFKMSDTLFVVDAYQDMLENILKEPGLKLVQKVVLVTGYMGLTSLTPGLDYAKLGVDSLIFFEESLMKDYTSVFGSYKSYLLTNYHLAKTFNSEAVVTNEVGPVITISCIGNNAIAQQLINVFYNKYPNLNMFTFKIIAREDMNVFLNNITQSAGVVILDKDVVTKQMVYEIISTGTPVFLPERREYKDNEIIYSNFVIENDIFSIASSLAEFCTSWLTMSTSDLKETILKIADSVGVKDRTEKDFSNTVNKIVYEIQDNRATLFNELKSAAENEKKAELSATT